MNATVFPSSETRGSSILSVSDATSIAGSAMASCQSASSAIAHATSLAPNPQASHHGNATSAGAIYSALHLEYAKGGAW